MQQPQPLDDALISALADQFGTPLYVFDWRSVLDSRSELMSIIGDVPIRNWFSMKTAPVKPLIEAWHGIGESIEVVSPFELRAALSVGFQSNQILVNGPGKSVWLAQCELRGLNVVFDSIRECEQLGALARELEWVVGMRIVPSNQKDPDDPAYSGQFGISPASLKNAASILDRLGVKVSVIHFHLRSNVSHLRDFETAANEVIVSAQNAGLDPSVLDCGGGLPVPGEILRETNQATWSDEFLSFGKLLRRIIQSNPPLKQIWLENGRFLVGRAGVLVVRAIDAKEINRVQYVICDGGRITNAFPSDWERHRLRFIPSRPAATRVICLCGPTCMAYDWFDRNKFEVDIRPGDLVVWENAGAYHLPWETHFSFGHAAVLWLDNKGVPSLARPREQFEDWWGSWN